MRNREVAAHLYEMADLLEFMDVDFKPRAYRKAARNIESLGVDVQELYSQGQLESIPAVGRAIAEKIREYLETGHIKKLEELTQKIPVDIQSLSSVEAVGPKMIKALYTHLGVKTLDDLEKAARDHRIAPLKGFGEKIEQKILGNIAVARTRTARFILGFILPEAEAFLAHLKPYADEVALAGSLRRQKETIGDIDILATSSSPEQLMDRFISMREVEKVLAKGPTKSSIRTDSGVQMDLRVVPRESFGAALQYFTGSKEHNVEMRIQAIKQGFKLNEYGLFKDDVLIAGQEEDGIYHTLGMEWIPPELRENRGEIEAALQHRLPALVDYTEVRGDLHVHTTWSDGAHTIEEMVTETRHLGHRFIAITDHAGTLKIAGGLDAEQIRAQAKEIEMVRAQCDDIHVFHGVEANIMKDGTIDLDAATLKDVDVVLASIHSAFRMDAADMTARLVRAIENEHVDIIAHPTGRIIEQREPVSFDMEQVLETARDSGTILEINAYPTRLDLNDTYVKMATEMGVKLSIGTDSHTTEHLQFYRLGVSVARRGWTEKADIINTFPVKELKKLFST